MHIKFSILAIIILLASCNKKDEVVKSPNYVILPFEVEGQKYGGGYSIAYLSSGKKTYSPIFVWSLSERAKFTNKSLVVDFEESEFVILRIEDVLSQHTSKFNYQSQCDLAEVLIVDFKNSKVKDCSHTVSTNLLNQENDADQLVKKLVEFMKKEECK